MVVVTAAATLSLWRWFPPPRHLSRSEGSPVKTKSQLRLFFLVSDHPMPFCMQLPERELTNVGDIVVATGWDLAWHGTCEGEGHFALLCNGNGD